MAIVIDSRGQTLVGENANITLRGKKKIMTNGPKVGRKVELKIGLVLMRFLVFPNQLFTQICSYQPDYQHSHKLIPLLPKTNNSPTCQQPNSSTSTFLIKKSNEFYYRIIHTSMTLLILLLQQSFMLVWLETNGPSQA